MAAKEIGKIEAVCVSRTKGTAKQNIGQAILKEDYGLQGDAHAGSGHRQVSLLSAEKIEEFQKTEPEIRYGSFGENLVVSGIDPALLPIGTRLRCGTVLLEITQIGKECHSGCTIARRTGTCIMPTNGVFARVLTEGTIRTGDCFEVVSNK